MVSSFNDKFRSIKALGNNEVISENLTNKKQKGTFDCCIVRFVKGLFSVQFDDPAKFKMVKVADSIHRFVSDSANTALFAQKTEKSLTAFKERLVFLSGKAKANPSAVSKLDAAIDKITVLISAKQPPGPTQQQIARARQHIQSLGNGSQSLSATPTDLRQPEVRRVQSAPSNLQSAQHQAASYGSVSVRNKKVGDQDGIAQQDGVVAAISTLHRKSGTVSKKKVVTVDPKDAEKMAKNKQEARAQHLVHDLDGTDSNAVFRARKTRQPRKQVKEVDASTADQVSLDVGAKLAGAKAALKPPKKDS